MITEELENNLLDYMRKLYNIADFFARGNVLGNKDSNTEIAIVELEAIGNRRRFSLNEYSIINQLEITFMGEQKSIGVLIEILNNGSYERLIQKVIDFNETYIPPKDKKSEYHIIMNRVKEILKQMMVSLAIGNHIPIEYMDAEQIIEIYSFDEKIEEIENRKVIYINEETGFEYYQTESNNEVFDDEYIESEEIEDEEFYLVYNIQNDNFSMINNNNKIIIENISFETAMPLVNEFFKELEKQELKKRHEIKKRAKEKRNTKRQDER